MFPLGMVLLPGGILPLHVFEPRYRELVVDCLLEEGEPESRVWISMEGRTKPLVPEFAIKGPMEDQLLQMSEALQALL